MKRLMVCGCILLTLPTCMFAADLHGVITKYRSAYANKDSKSLFALLDSSTREFVVKLKDKSLYLGRSELGNEPLIAKILIVQTRCMCSAEQLVRMKNDEFYYLLLTNDLVGLTDGMEERVGERESINGNEGIIETVRDGKKSHMIHFTKENDGWKLNVFTLIKTANDNSSYLIKNNRWSEEKLLNTALAGNRDSVTLDQYFEPLSKR